MKETIRRVHECLFSLSPSDKKSQYGLTVWIPVDPCFSGGWPSRQQYILSSKIVMYDSTQHVNTSHYMAMGLYTCPREGASVEGVILDHA